jgi:predicted dehydrogenase
MTAKIRYGVLSTAQIARNAHIPAARKATNTEIVAISSRDLGRAQEWADKLGIPKAYGSYDEVLADPDIDAIINPLPNSMHCEWTIKSAQAGKHILCEKPFAVTVEQAQRMIGAAQAHGVKLMEGFTHRFTPLASFLRENLDSGVIGEVQLVRTELTYTIADWETDTRVKRDLAGGALLDAGCYCVNTIRYLMGDEPLGVQAYQRIHKPEQVDSTFTGTMRFPGDRFAYLVTGMEQPFRHCCEVTGTKGWVWVPNLFAADKAVVVAGGEERTVTFESTNRFQVQLEHFSDCILADRSPMLTLKDALGNTAALVALQQAAREGREVEID